MWREPPFFDFSFPCEGTLITVTTSILSTGGVIDLVSEFQRKKQVFFGSAISLWEIWLTTTKEHTALHSTQVGK